MPLLTAPQEALYDATGAVINALVYAYTPQLVFEAPLNGYNVRAKAYVSLEYGTPTVGDIADVLPEMTVQIDIDGVGDGGRQRVRGTDSGSSLILVGRSAPGNADGRLTVTGGGTIRVYDDRRPFIKAPHISRDGLTQYKDETVYPSDNAAQPPVVNMGRDRLIIKESAASIDLSGADSHAVRAGATISTYLWDVGDGTITVGTSADDEITASFPVGARYITLTVTDSNGVSSVGHRLIVVARRADCLPAQIQEWVVTPDGSSMSLKIDSTRLPAGLPTGAKVLVSEIENYGTTNLIGYAERFSGWIGTEQAALEDARSQKLPITVELIDGARFLNENYLFPQSINIAEDTGGWYAMADANMDRLMHHILAWHTNILSLSDFYWSGEGATYPFAALTTSGGSFWSNLNHLANGIAHQLTFDSTGVLRVMGDPHILPSAAQATADTLPTQRATGVVTTFEENNLATFNLNERQKAKSYWLTAQAIIAAEVVNDVVTAIAPANAPGLGTSAAQENNWLVTTQAELNVWAANAYAAKHGATTGELSIKVINPTHIIEPALREYVAAVIPDRFADRYNHADGDRWTVESISYTFDGTEKKATYSLLKEVVATDKARTTDLTEDDDAVQAWSGFDGSISPTTGAVLQEFEGVSMGLTQAELEQTLRKTRLKVYLSDTETDVDGNTGEDGDTDTDTGVTDQELAASQRNGGFYYVALRWANFLSDVASTYADVSGEIDGKALLIAFIKAYITEVGDTEVSDWVDQIFDVDAAVPSISVAQRADITEYAYCAGQSRAGLSKWIYSLTSTNWDKYQLSLAAISDTQLTAWYDEGFEIPIDQYQGYYCYIYPQWSTRYLETQIEAAAEKQGTAMDLTSRTDGSFFRVRVSGTYETATYIYDAYWRYTKADGTLTASSLTFGVMNSTSFGLFNRIPIAPPVYPDYNESHVYTVTGEIGVMVIGFFAPRYYIDDNRSLSGGTGYFDLIFTDLGVR